MKLGAASEQRYCEQGCAGSRCCGGFDCCYNSVLIDGWISIGHDDEEERPEERKKLYAAGGERLVAKRMSEEDEGEKMRVVVCEEGGEAEEDVRACKARGPKGRRSRNRCGQQR